MDAVLLFDFTAVKAAASCAPPATQDGAVGDCSLQCGMVRGHRGL